jgi:hypothetical protein
MVGVFAGVARTHSAGAPAAIATLEKLGHAYCTGKRSKNIDFAMTEFSAGIRASLSKRWVTVATDTACGEKSTGDFLARG